MTIDLSTPTGQQALRDLLASPATGEPEMADLAGEYLLPLLDLLAELRLTLLAERGDPGGALEGWTFTGGLHRVWSRVTETHAAEVGWQGTQPKWAVYRNERGLPLVAAGKADSARAAMRAAEAALSGKET